MDFFKSAIKKETDSWLFPSGKGLTLNGINAAGIDTFGADVKIMDRLFWHREVPHSENFSKPGFQLKTA